MAVAFAAGVPTDKVISNFESGVGSTLQEVGLLTVGQTFKTWSVMETALSLVAFGLVTALSVVI